MTSASAEQVELVAAAAVVEHEQAVGFPARVGGAFAEEEHQPR